MRKIVHKEEKIGVLREKTITQMYKLKQAAYLEENVFR